MKEPYAMRQVLRARVGDRDHVLVDVGDPAEALAKLIDGVGHPDRWHRTLNGAIQERHIASVEIDWQKDYSWSVEIVHAA